MHRRIRGAALAVAAAAIPMLALASCSLAQEEAAAPGEAPLQAGQLAAFARECEETLSPEQWRPGQVDYPAKMSVRLGQGTDYSAAVDVREAPLAPESLIDSTDPAAAPVLVKCGISAKLVAVDSGIEVAANAEGIVSDGWYFRTFDPSGTVEWTWTVTAAAPGEHSLRFMLRPSAVSIATAQAGSAGQTSYLTRVTASATRVERIWHWFQTDFTLLQKILALVGSAVVGFLVWLALLSDKWGALRKK